MLELTVVAEALAVISGNDDRRRCAATRGRRFEGRDEPRHLTIHGSHLAEIARARVSACGRAFRRVRRMRIEVVNPDEVWLRGGLREIGDSGVGRGPRGALDLTGWQTVVVDVESSRKTEPPRQDERRHERRRAIAGVLETSGEDRMRVGQIARVLVDAVAGGIEARHHRTVRGQRLRRRRVCLAESQAAGRESVEAPGLDAAGFGAYGVGSSRIERHQQNRRA